MAPKEVYIRYLKPNMASWRAKLTVVEVFPPLVEAYTLQKFVFADVEGNEIEGIVWGETNINRISAGLQLYSVYAMGVKKIDVVNPAYKLANNDYQLVLTPNDYYNKVENQRPSLQSLANDIVSFDNLSSLVDTYNPINILAVIVDCGVTMNTKNGKSRWLKVITKEHQMLLFTLWDEYATYHGPDLDLYSQEWPVIIARRAIVRSFHTVSLSTRRRRTSIGINPPTEQAYILKAWFLGIKDSLSTKLLTSTEIYYTKELLQAGSKNFCSLAHIQSEQMAGHYLTMATIQCLPSKKMFFVACKFCKTSVNNADLGEELKCGACHRKTILIPRALANLELKDSTSTITLAALGETAECLIGITADQLAQQYIEGKPFDLDTLNENLSNKKYHIKIIKSNLQTTVRGIQQQRTIIASVFEVDKTKESKLIATSPRKSAIFDLYDANLAESSNKNSILEGADAIDVESHARDFMEAAKKHHLYFLSLRREERPTKQEVSAMEEELKMNKQLIGKQENRIKIRKVCNKTLVRAYSFGSYE